MNKLKCEPEIIVAHFSSSDILWFFQAVEQTTVKIIRYQSPLYFANGDIFVKEVYRLSTVKPERLRKQIRRASEISRRASLVSNNSIALAENNSRKDSAISISSNSSEMVNIYFFHGD